MADGFTELWPEFEDFPEQFQSRMEAAQLSKLDPVKMHQSATKGEIAVLTAHIGQALSNILEGLVEMRLQRPEQRDTAIIAARDSLAEVMISIAEMIGQDSEGAA